MMERQTEKVEVKLLNGESVSVSLYKGITLTQKYDVLTEAQASAAKHGLVNIDVYQIVPALVKRLWADKNYSLEDIEGTDLNVWIISQIATFLGEFGYSGKIKDTKSSENE